MNAVTRKNLVFSDIDLQAREFITYRSTPYSTCSTELFHPWKSCLPKKTTSVAIMIKNGGKSCKLHYQ